jgi:hypothetical protein
METKIDYSDLNRPVTAKDIWGYRSYSIPGGSSLIGVAFVALLIAPPIAFVGLHGKTAFTYALIWVTFGAGMLGLIAWLYVRGVVNSIRLERFAKTNGLEYHKRIVPAEQGIIFQLGSERHSDQVISGQYNGRDFWFGTHYYTIGSGKNRRTVASGVLNVTLPRAVPNVIIDGRQNRLPIGGEFDRSQRLELEGDFNNYFTVYCPKNYERDVLYFLTPELMQALVDMNDKFDVEMLDHELYFYSKSTIKPDEQHLRDLFKVIDDIGGEVSENTQRYQDWRVTKGLDVVAPEGMRLKRSIWPTVIALTIFFLYMLQVILDLF